LIWVKKKEEEKKEITVTALEEKCFVLFLQIKKPANLSYCFLIFHLVSMKPFLDH
jgi:hypothetical protein